jgi:hypothetical protein
MRWFRPTIAILSLLLCLWALLAWAWSYVPPKPHFVASRGSLLIANLDLKDESIEAYGGAEQIVPQMVHFGDEYEHFLGFARVSGSYGMLGGFRIVVIPFWSIILLTAPAPLLWWRSVHRSRRWQASGKCTGCGYDLRGSPERCPECGTPNHSVKPATVTPS